MGVGIFPSSRRGPYEIDRNFSAVGVFDYDGKLPGVMSVHPKSDPLSGELLSVRNRVEMVAQFV